MQMETKQFFGYDMLRVCKWRARNLGFVGPTDTYPSWSWSTNLPWTRCSRVIPKILTILCGDAAGRHDFKPRYTVIHNRPGLCSTKDKTYSRPTRIEEEMKHVIQKPSLYEFVSGLQEVSSSFQDQTIQQRTLLVFTNGNGSKLRTPEKLISK